MISWISKSDLDREVELLRARAADALMDAETRRVRNVVDPFLSLLIATTFEIRDPVTLADTQRAEAAMRGMGSALGDFHQGVLGAVDGWNDHDAGYDLECTSRRIVAEVKNKWNTMNSSNRRAVLTDLETAARQKIGAWTAYLVLVIPKSPIRYEENLGNNVIETDGASFYHTVTGMPNAIHDLLNYLCEKFAASDAIAKYCLETMDKSLPPRL